MLRVSNCIADSIRPIVPQATEWQGIANEIDAAFIFARANVVHVHHLQRRKLAFQSQAPFGNLLDKSARFLRHSAHMKTTTLQLTHSVNGSHVKFAFLLIALACFALSPQARAVCQEGCLTNDNTVLGDDALISNTSGGSNVGIGAHALTSNTIGSGNIAIGIETLFSNLSGTANTASGALALHDTTTGNNNTANGYAALFSNTSGNDNTAIGFQALISNTTSSDNTANGFKALFSNTLGSWNVATGSNALYANTTGYTNTATGYVALYNNIGGYQNTATGSQALYYNTTGNGNTADGIAALESNTTGSQNAAFGLVALAANTTGFLNTAIGTAALPSSKTGHDNIAVGFYAGLHIISGSNNIDIGTQGVEDESGVIRIGTERTHTATYIAGIREAPLVHGTAVAVGITADGQLGVRASSARFKEAIKPMNNASKAIFSLQPVTFHYKKDPAAVPQFCLVAEEVAKVNPDLVIADNQGKPLSVRYEEINAMLLNEFLKEHRKNEEQGATITQQRKDFEAALARQQKQIDALTAGLQKVSAQLELSKSAPQTVVGNQ